MTRRKVVAGCGIVVVILLLLGGCGVARLTAELPAGEHPDVDFQSDEIVAAREAKVTALEAQLALVEGRFGTRYVGLPGRRDRCDEGQDNFTRQDRWAYTCRIAITRVLPLGDPFRESASSLGEALLEGDCPDGTDTDRELGRFSGDPQDLNASSGDCTPGTFTAGAAEIAGWLPARPTQEELERAEAQLADRCYGTDAHCERIPLDLRAAVEAAPADAAWLAVVTADDTYYTVPWDCPWPASWFKDSCSRRGAGVR